MHSIHCSIPKITRFLPCSLERQPCQSVFTIQSIQMVSPYPVLESTIANKLKTVVNRDCLVLPSTDQSFRLCMIFMTFELCMKNEN